MGTDLIFVITRLSDEPGSRLHDDIIMCLIDPRMDEIFKNLECQHWVPKFDTGR